MRKKRQRRIDIICSKAKNKNSDILKQLPPKEITMKKTTRILALCCVMAIMITGFALPQKANAAEPMVVAEDISSLTFLGVPLSEYTVVLGTDATTGIKRTTNNLIKYIKEATGAELKIAGEGEVNDYEICIGKTDRETEKVSAARDSLTRNGIAIVADGNKIFITGHEEQAVIYSIYTFLEDYLGYRFYANDYHVAKLEYATEFPSDLNYTYSPIFIGRDMDWVDVLKGYDTVGYRDLEYNNALKLNGFFSRYAGNYRDYGGDIAGCSVHSVASLTNTSSGSQPCLSDEAIFQTALAKVRASLAANPNQIIDVSQNDNGDFCQCEKCHAIDMEYSYDGENPYPAASLVNFANRIAREIKDEYPNAYICTLAYGYSKAAPKDLEIEDNVIIRLCNIECCFAHPLEDESCTFSDSANSAYMENLERWSSMAKNLYIWDYTTNFNRYTQPYPNFDVLWENIQTYRDNNAIAVFEEGNRDSQNTEFSDMRAYLLAKLMWNPNMTKEEYNQMMEEYLRDYYGSGWKYIKRFIDITTDDAQRYHMGLYSDVNTYIRTMENTPAANMEYYESLINLFNKAYNRAETDEQRRHVRHARTQMESLYLECYFDPETDAERIDELYCDFLDMNAYCLKEHYHYRFPRRWKFVQGPGYWWSW